MPQLPSGRRIGLSADRVFDLVLQADARTFTRLQSSVQSPEDLLPWVDLVEFVPTTGVKDPGVETMTGLVAADIGSQRCDWPEADQHALLDWLHSGPAEEWLEERFDELEAALESAAE